ncbi:putative deferrochelatase/peroxidase EfeN [Capillimicrobium parvum]|uniref:Deferrochelatase n=1 Tax=Capillimicrobium parvum TaxID=2884022 RepID=A0A9E6XZN3_9ACTN|nr:iron uptake transporter deferrochelatase/peroxidase subunit [Capillimicrobium parvum]UGS37472.1 putative deferrochelatase/peroxidase EfeN [Capillimicrobium parvum]
MSEPTDPTSESQPAEPARPRRRLSRRALLGGAGAGAAALAAGGVGIAIGSADSGSSSSSGAGDHVVPFDGEHQAGIATAAQDRLHFAAFDVVSDRREDVAGLLRAWTEAARRMTAGRPPGPANAVELAPPDDTGEAFGLTAARLTVTIGFGPSLFDGRFGLAARRPAALRDLPALPGDELDGARSGGDLCVQACADDPQVAFHAVRNLARIARGTAVIRWSQLGFGRTSSTSRAQDTPRNLMGFKDGTNNLKAEDRAALAESVWVGGEAPDWMRGGTYLVARRIRMLIEVWDRASLGDQEQTFGRHKVSGAPFGGRAEFDAVDPARLPADSHVRLARPESNGGAALLRRGYSFTDGLDDQLGQLDAGLFFISFQRDPDAFVKVQSSLARDALNEYIKHVGSAVFAVPGGTQPGGYVGQPLFA